MLDTKQPKKCHVRVLTFQVKEHIGSIIFEHLSNKFDIHVLDVDFLVRLVPALVQYPWQAGSEYILAEIYLRLQRLRSISPG